MRELPDGRVLLRWIFLAFGLFLLFCTNFVVHSVLRADAWAKLLFADAPRLQTLVIATSYLIIGPCGLLCLATAWGLKRSRRWSRWTGACACTILLAGFPWFTVAGAMGLFVLIARPPRLGPGQQPGEPAKAKQTKDYWISKRKSRAQSIMSGIGGVLAFNAVALAGVYARRLGLPAWNPGWEWWLYLFAFLLLNTAVHELGHAIMAWALYHSVRVISIGPFTFSNVGHGYQFHFDWKRMFDSSGYMGAVPLTGGNLRLKCIATVAGGPAASLLSGLLMLAVFLSLPGTRWQNYWWIAAFNSVLGIYYAVINLVPVGYSDGSMLFHLILWTRAGQQLLSRALITQIHEDADACHGRAHFEKEVELRERALGKAVEGGDQSAFITAACHQALGLAKLAVEDWAGAETEFRKCLEFEAECALETALPANAWLGLHWACVERHHVSEAGRAYVSAVAIIEGRKKNRDRVGLAVARTMMARVHERAGNFELALKEVTEALQILPGGRDRLLLRAELYAAQALNELGLSFIDSGMAAAERAAEILRSGQIPPARQNLAWDELGELAEGLWRAGQSATAVDLLREAVEQLEAGGAAATAAQYRIKLAAVLRQLGRLEEASQWLPKADNLSAISRRSLLAERAQLQLTAGALTL
jgi:tetratricopeptide (TPR) repeat protein